MVKLTYGGGNCSIEGSDIRAVHIFYTGSIQIDDKTPDGYEIMMGNQQIIIFPITAQVPLSDLFTYKGVINIKNISVADSNAQLISSAVSRSMDYPEIMHSKSEDMTIKAEDMSAGYQHGGRKTNSLKQPVIENLNTGNEGSLYYKDGTEYTGGFYHIHKKDSKAMTGATHSEKSEDLYYLIDDEIIPTKNESHIPLAKKKKAKGGKRRTTKKVVARRSSTKGGSY